MKVFSLLKDNYINKSKILIENYKKINLTNNELIVVLYIIHNIDKNNRFILSNKISNFIDFSQEEIDNIYDSLITKKLIEIKMSSDENIEFNLNPLFSCLLSKISDDEKNINLEELLNEKPNKEDFNQKNEKITSFNWLDED